MTRSQQSNREYHRETSAQMRLASVERRLEAAEDGSGIAALREEFRQYRARMEKQIAALKRAHSKALLKVQKETERVMANFLAVNEDVVVYAEKQQERLRRKMQKSLDRLYAQIAGLLAKLEELEADLKAQKAHIQELEAENRKKDTQIGVRDKLLRMDHTNSGVSTGQEGILHGRKKVSNNRQPSERKQGAQVGHRHHPRPEYAATRPKVVVAETEVLGEDWVQIDERVKYVADAELVLHVTPFSYGIYKNIVTGEIRKMPIPESMKDELNYGPGLKALCLLLNQYHNMPSRKVAQFIREASGGAIHISNGFVSGLASEFAAKSTLEWTQIFGQLVSTKHMFVDSTVAKVDGKRHCILINTDGDAVMLAYSRHKGKEAVAGSPYEQFSGIAIHDGEETFYLFGLPDMHQECVAHRLRNAQAVMDNDPERQWAHQMRALLQALFRHHRSWTSEHGPDDGYRERIRSRYQAILDFGEKEYEQRPTPEAFPEGPKYLAHFRKRAKNILFFLDHPGIPLDNSEAERGFRCVKAKQKVGGTWRSAKSVDDYARNMTVLKTEEKRGNSLLAKAAEVFGRERPAQANEAETDTGDTTA